jgi:threonyl-tRNA synthetase
LGATYIGDDSAKHTPVMLHRAMFGSLERFIGILLEHHAGKLPTWLAPVQAVITGITDRQSKYIEEIAENLKNQGLRVETDLRNEKLGFKIREHIIKRVPYVLVAGDREVEGRTLAVRTRSGKDLGAIGLVELASLLSDEVASRGRLVLEDRVSQLRSA